MSLFIKNPTRDLPFNYKSINFAQKTRLQNTKNPCFALKPQKNNMVGINLRFT